MRRQITDAVVQTADKEILMRTETNSKTKTPSLFSHTLSLPLRGTLLSANVLTSTNNHLYSINHGSDSTIPVFCIYKRSTKNTSPTLDEQKKSGNPSPLMLLYKKVDEQNTKSPENIVYAWSIEFLLEVVDECDDTIDGQIREHIDFWQKDRALFFALGSFLKTQITTDNDLKELIRGLYLSFTFKYKIKEEDYGFIYAFFMLHLKNSFPALCHNQKETIARILSGFPNPDIIKPALDELVVETYCFTLNNLTNDESNRFKQVLLERPISSNQTLTTFNLLTKVHLFNPENNFYNPTRFTPREMKLLIQLLTRLKQTDISIKLEHLVSRQFHDRFVTNTNQLAYLINHIYFSDKSLDLLFSTFFFNEQNLETLIKESNPETVIDDLISILQSNNIEKKIWQERIWEIIRHKLVPKFIKNIDEFIRIRALPFLESQDKLIAFISSTSVRLHEWIRNENELTRFIRCLHLSGKESDNALREFIWNALKEQILKHVNSAEELDAFLTCSELNEAEKKEWHQLAVGAKWVSHAGQLNVVCESNVLDNDDKKSAVAHTFARLTGSTQQQPSHTSTHAATNPVPETSQLPNKTEDEIQSDLKQLKRSCALGRAYTVPETSQLPNRTEDEICSGLRQQQRSHTSTHAATNPVPETSQLPNKTEKEIHSADAQCISPIFLNIDQFIKLFNQFDKSAQQRRLYLDALKHASENIISNSDEFVRLFDECELTQPERDEIWEYSKLTLIEKMKRHEDTTYALFSCTSLTDKQNQETLTTIAPHLKRIIINLNDFLKFYQSSRFSNDYRIELLNVFKTELTSWINNIDSFCTHVLECGLKTDQFDLFWNHHLQHIICKLVEANSFDKLINVFNCSILTDKQRNHLCTSEKLMQAYIKNIVLLTKLIDSPRMTRSNQNNLFLTIGFSNLKKIIYPAVKNEHQDTLCLDKLFQSNYLNFSNQIIKRIILSEPVLFNKWCHHFNEQMGNYINTSEIDPEDCEMIVSNLTLLRTEYRMRIVKAPNEESCCTCSFFSSADNSELLEIKIEGIEQILDEIMKSPARTPNCEQWLIDVKKKIGRLGRLAQLWEKTKVLLYNANANENENENEQSYFFE